MDSWIKEERSKKKDGCRLWLFKSICLSENKYAEYLLRPMNPTRKPNGDVKKMLIKFQQKSIFLLGLRLSGHYGVILSRCDVFKGITYMYVLLCFIDQCYLLVKLCTVYYITKQVDLIELMWQIYTLMCVYCPCRNQTLVQYVFRNIMKIYIPGLLLIAKYC